MDLTLVAEALCDGLADQGRVGLKSGKPRQQRIQLLLKVFEACGIDGARLRVLTDSELRTLWLAQTSSYAWGEDALCFLQGIRHASDGLEPSSTDAPTSIFLRKDALDALWRAYADDIDFDTRLSTELHVQEEETVDHGTIIEQFLMWCFEKSDPDAGASGAHFAGVLLDRWIRCGNERASDAASAGVGKSNAWRLVSVQGVFEHLRDPDVMADNRCDLPNIGNYLDQAGMIALESERGPMANVFLVRNGGSKIFKQIRAGLRSSVCIRAPGSQHGESPQGMAEMRDTVAAALEDGHRTEHLGFDVIMSMSRGVDLVADFHARLSADLRTSASPHVLLLSPASLSQVEEIVKTRRQLAKSFHQPRLLVALAANDLMDVPGATHPNCSAASLANLISMFSSEDEVSSSRVCRVRASRSDLNRSVADDIRGGDTERLASLLEVTEVVHDVSGAFEAASSNAVLCIFEDLVEPWDTAALSTLVGALRP